jgi:thioredoxin 2
MSINEASVLQIACPHCHTLNRVPETRVDEEPACGRCQTPLFDGKPVSLGAGSFDRHLGRSELPLVVDFWAAWCAPCRIMEPAFAQAAAMEPRVRFAKLDTEAESAIAERYRIRSIPTMILFRRGREVARTSGAMPASAILDWMRSNLG